MTRLNPILARLAAATLAFLLVGAATSVRLNCEQIQLVALDVIVGFVVSSGNRVTKQHFFEERH